MVSAYYRMHCRLEIVLLLVAVCEFQYGSRFSDPITISFTYGIHNYLKYNGYSKQKYFAFKVT